MFFDGRLVVLILLAAMHIAIWTFLLATIAILGARAFEAKGISIDDILRFLRARLVGKRRPARNPSEDRVAVDFGFETLERIEAFEKREGLIRNSRAEAHKKALAKKKKGQKRNA
mgnify:CR=1 FL=1